MRGGWGEGGLTCWLCPFHRASCAREVGGHHIRWGVHSGGGQHGRQHGTRQRKRIQTGASAEVRGG